IGLVWANGGFVTKHAFGTYSTTPPSQDFRHAEPQDEIDALPKAGWADAETASHDTTTHIEAYTVMHGRTSQPETAWAAIRLADGRRTFGKSDDPALLAHLLEGEHVGELVQVMSNHQFEPLN
ncbi:MAG: hypothetical protein VX322_01485, partial [Actinomycetota bacterium]|nr:hypothetical protein [Actinomycetota bacterium]